MRHQFDHFTERARKVLSLAQEEAQRFNHNYIGTEHLLLGLVREGDGVAAKVLNNLGVELNKVRSAVEFIIWRGDRIVLGEIGLTPRAKKVIELAVDEARRLNHHYIGTEHLLLGLVREGDGVAAKVLNQLGVTHASARNAVEQVVGRGDRIVLGEIGLTPQAKKAIELTVGEARRLNHHYIGTEHLLLGLARSDDETLAAILTIFGVDSEAIRADTVRILSRVASSMSPQTAAVTSPVTGRMSHITGQMSHTAPGDWFTRFTERARKVLSLAQEEAHRFNHNYIGTEHLLLGLVREEDGVGAKVLQNLGVQLNTARSAVEFIIWRGDRIVLGEIGLTPRAKKVIELAVDEANRLDHQYIGTEHLLLGLIREGEGIAAGVLASLGINLERARRETLRMLGEPPATEGPASDHEV